MAQIGKSIVNKNCIILVLAGIIFFASGRNFSQSLLNPPSSFNQNGNKSSSDKIQTDSTDEFPLKVGDKWTYSFRDSVLNIQDTIKVTIKNVYYLPNGVIRYLWLYQFTNKIDSLFVEQASDTIRFVPVSTDNFYNGISKLILPFMVGNKWEAIGDEEGSVDSIDTVIVPGGTFFNTYHIVQAGFCCNDYSCIQFWIQPGIGIVKEINSIFISVEPGSKRLENWELLSYSLNSITGAKYKNNIPKGFSLEQNYPNPFNPATTIQYEIPNSGLTTIKIYDVLGRDVRMLLNQYQVKGSHIIYFNASGLASGVYYYQLRTGNFLSTKKMILLK